MLTLLCSMGKTLLLYILVNPPRYLVDAFVAAVGKPMDLESLWTFMSAQLLHVGPLPPKSSLVPLQSLPSFSVCVTLRGALCCTANYNGAVHAHFFGAQSHDGICRPPGPDITVSIACFVFTDPMSDGAGSLSNVEYHKITPGTPSRHIDCVLAFMVMC